MLLLSVKADSDNDIISIVLHLRTRLLHPQPESSTARGKESKLQKKKKAMTGQREEKKKRTRVQMQLLRRPHLCARSEVKPKAAKSCLQVVPKPPSWREQVEKVFFFLFVFFVVFKKKKNFFRCYFFYQTCFLSVLTTQQQRCRGLWEERLLRVQSGRRVGRPRLPHTLVLFLFFFLFLSYLFPLLSQQLTQPIPHSRIDVFHSLLTCRKVT